MLFIIQKADRAKEQNWESSEYRVRRKYFRVPLWAGVPQVGQPIYRPSHPPPALPRVQKSLPVGSAVYKAFEINGVRSSAADWYQEMRIKLNCLLFSRAIISLYSIVSTGWFRLSQRDTHPVLVLRLNLSALRSLPNLQRLLNCALSIFGLTPSGRLQFLG